VANFNFYNSVIDKIEITDKKIESICDSFHIINRYYFFILDNKQ